MLASGQAALQAHLHSQHLLAQAPGFMDLVLSEQAAGDLLPLAARQANEAAYRTALQVNPRYARWGRPYVPLEGTLQEYQSLPAWADLPPEYCELIVRGEGPQRNFAASTCLISPPPWKSTPAWPCWASRAAARAPPWSAWPAGSPGLPG